MRADELGIKWNLITEKDTPVSQDVLDAVRATGGSVHSRVPGEDATFYDHGTDEYVHLTGGQGPSGRELQSEPLTPEETAQIETDIRAELHAKFNLQGPGGEGDGGELPGSSEPYVTAQEYDEAWGNADIGPDGDTPLPDAPQEETPGQPLEPAEPLPAEPEPLEPIGPEEFFEELIP